MKTHNDTLDSLGEWIDRPHDRLRKYPNGTLFLLRTAQGPTHLCSLVGNMETDVSWKAQRHTDYKIIRLENLRQGAMAFILSNVRDEVSPLASGATPTREAESAGGGTEVPKGW